MREGSNGERRTEEGDTWRRETRGEQAALTDVVYRALGWHVRLDARKHVRGVLRPEQRPAELGVVADQHARVEPPREEVLPRVVELRLGEALEADALVDVAQLVGLCACDARGSAERCVGRMTRRTGRAGAPRPGRRTGPGTSSAAGRRVLVHRRACALV